MLFGQLSTRVVPSSSSQRHFDCINAKPKFTCNFSQHSKANRRREPPQIVAFLGVNAVPGISKSYSIETRTQVDGRPQGNAARAAFWPIVRFFLPSFHAVRDDFVRKTIIPIQRFNQRALVNNTAQYFTKAKTKSLRVSCWLCCRFLVFSHKIYKKTFTNNEKRTHTHTHKTKVFDTKSKQHTY